MPGLGKFLKQAQRLQEQMQKVQEELAQREVEASAGGGVVSVTARCDGTIARIRIDPKAVSADDVEMLEDLVLAAVNNALELARKTQNEEMSKLTAGLNLSPGFKL
ncbi:MAG: YbaB/EbfC family nucleoid-associated protein [Verrucomicrobiae bacterium]|nr:YbaB/EbfC family nucleoid-associated protein [Verrucomicrobiae bacterium]